MNFTAVLSALLLVVQNVEALVTPFAPSAVGRSSSSFQFAKSTTTETTILKLSSQPSDSRSLDRLTLDELKIDLVRCCTRSSKPLLDEVRSLVSDLEEKAEMASNPPLLMLYSIHYRHDNSYLL
jgi:hypothetical protein